MVDHSLHTIDKSIYPGTFCRKCFPAELVLPNRNKEQKGKVSSPAVHFIEMSHYFRVDLRIPGVKRENIVVRTRRNLLDVFVYFPALKNTGPFHGSNNQCLVRFEKHLPLPRNSDADLIQAEYNDGILQVFIPKSSRNPDPIFHSVPVY